MKRPSLYAAVIYGYLLFVGQSEREKLNHISAGERKDSVSLLFKNSILTQLLSVWLPSMKSQAEVHNVTLEAHFGRQC